MTFDEIFQQYVAQGFTKPTQISGTPVNNRVVSNQNLGQRFNIAQDPRG